MFTGDSTPQPEVEEVSHSVTLRKPLVRYKKILSDRISVGSRCSLVPVDHWNGSLNGRHVVTSVVQKCNSTWGTIETENTIYLPQIGRLQSPYFTIE